MENDIGCYFSNLAKSKKKYDKTHITINLTYNIIGLYKLDL